MKKILITAMAVLTLGAGGAAMAQPRHDDHDNWERQADHRYNAGRYREPRGYAVRHWRHGDVLPRAYRTSAYNVDYRRYHLAPPPRGYHYVRVGNDVVLAAIASGVITSVIMQLFQ